VLIDYIDCIFSILLLITLQFYEFTSINKRCVESLSAFINDRAQQEEIGHCSINELPTKQSH